MSAEPFPSSTPFRFWLVHLTLAGFSNILLSCGQTTWKIKRSFPNLLYYYMARWSRGKSERSDRFFLGREWAIRTVSMETIISCVFFWFSKASKLKTSITRVPWNQLLTNLAGSSRTGKNWPSVVFVRTSLFHDLGPIFPSTALVLG